MTENKKQPLAMIVEDDPKQADIFAMALQNGGYSTEIIDNGQEALERFADVVPYLVVLDLHLPSVSGAELLHHIRADKRLENVWVILATANPQTAVPLENESDFILHKPVSFVQLNHLVKRLHERQRV